MGDVKINFNESEVKSDNLSGVLISEDAAESLVRCFLPDIVSFFESDAGRKDPVGIFVLGLSRAAHPSDRHQRLV